ncbi:unnamed protein product [Orchesella dallaii]|uniref:Uncharacterized protein n=1 Tax=Orchesella dallaii TaxID=48710 RepID=A0ABP1QMM1_9HEXA
MVSPNQAIPLKLVQVGVSLCRFFSSPLTTFLLVNSILIRNLHYIYLSGGWKMKLSIVGENRTRLLFNNDISKTLPGNGKPRKKCHATQDIFSLVFSFRR